MTNNKNEPRVLALILGGGKAQDYILSLKNAQSQLFLSAENTEL